ncbi:MAG TPA: GeoRSP system PqqD family peptide chaperone [Nitrospirae bacterium]|nr:coenzyme PQQ synthesis protein D [bacterium BMS3Abin10]HDK82473.1 GeoRSP system PqqD family peptide chaperone [Nitrospirota bacterium]HDO26447.1 GeoRSP system PqqD family peptide chaperone [Nitrospirota bacterium]
MKIFRNPDVMWREEDELKKQAYEGLERGDDVEDVGTSVLFVEGNMLSLNILGTEIWKRCEGRTIDEIVSELADIFEVDKKTLKNDVSGFLDELKDKGYIYYEN